MKKNEHLVLKVRIESEDGNYVNIETSDDEKIEKMLKNLTTILKDNLAELKAKIHCTPIELVEIVEKLTN